MIVPSHIARLLSEGVATQLRLPTSPDQRITGGLRVPAPCRWKVGKDYPVRKSTVTALEIEGREGIQWHIEREPVYHPDGERLRLLIHNVRRSTLTDLDYRDAKREGYRAATWREDLLETWMRHYQGVRPDMPVWVLSVSVQHDRPRFLAFSGSQATRVRMDGDEASFSGSEHDYVSSPAGALDECEVFAVDPAWDQAGAVRHLAARPASESTGRLARALRPAA